MHFFVQVSTSLDGDVSDGVVMEVVEEKEGGRRGQRGGGIYWLNILETISISASAAAIFSAEEGWGRAPPPKRKDMFAVLVLGSVESGVVVWCSRSRA